jgi:hypothetical protein
MEPKTDETDHASELTEAQRKAAGVKQPAFTAPFASEGLERVRDRQPLLRDAPSSGLRLLALKSCAALSGDAPRADTHSIQRPYDSGAA